jgi:hypothetical protein
MNWTKTGRTVYGDGATTIRYQADGTDLVIESRKKAIPHAAKGGCWFHTSYFLIRPDGTEKEYWTLKDAKAAAER